MKLDPKDAAGIERAAALVYEAVTGGCWHYTPIAEGIRLEVPQICEKCGKEWTIWCPPSANPPLATSLDAWRPLWEKMDVFQTVEYDMALQTINIDGTFMWQADPLMHLEAALRALGLVEKWEAGG